MSRKIIKMRLFLENLFITSTGHTYSNLSRLFLRLFTGVMFLQFGIRQILYFDQVASHSYGVLGMSGETTMILMIAIEIFCSMCIILGFLTRLNVLPPLVSMCFAENIILSNMVHVSPVHLFSTQPGYLPVMFIGIFIYILLAGPGKISMDYVISMQLLGMRERRNKEQEQILEEA